MSVRELVVALLDARTRRRLRRAWRLNPRGIATEPPVPLLWSPDAPRAQRLPGHEARIVDVTFSLPASWAAYKEPRAVDEAAQAELDRLPTNIRRALGLYAATRAAGHSGSEAAGLLVLGCRDFWESLYRRLYITEDTSS